MATTRLAFPSPLYWRPGTDHFQLAWSLSVRLCNRSGTALISGDVITLTYSCLKNLDKGTSYKNLHRLYQQLCYVVLEGTLRPLLHIHKNKYKANVLWHYDKYQMEITF